jgi:hypothetical protein
MGKECVFCGGPPGPNPYRKVTGWERHRQQGGTNALRLREQHEEVACMHCIEREARGVSAQQGAFT